MVSIGDLAFKNNTNIKTVVLQEGITSIGTKAFLGATQMTRIDLPSTLSSIGSFAFASAISLIEIDIPTGVTQINNATFFNCKKLERVTIPNTVTQIGAEAFRGCESLTELYIPSSVKEIRGFAFFENTSLSKIVFSEGLEEIGANAFYGCRNLEELVLPSTLKVVRFSAFREMLSLKRVTFLSHPNMNDNKTYPIFDSTPALQEIIINIVRKEASPAFTDQEPWGASPNVAIKYLKAPIEFTHNLSTIPGEYARNIDLSAKVGAGKIEKLILPDHTELSISKPSDQYTYKVTANGTYTFKGLSNSSDTLEEYNVQITEIGQPQIQASNAVVNLSQVSSITKNKIYSLTSASANDEIQSLALEMSDQDLANVRGLTKDGESVDITLKATSPTGLSKEIKVTITAKKTSTGGGGGTGGSLGAAGNGSTQVAPTPSISGTWQTDNNGWQFKKDDGTVVKNDWGLISGKWYHFNEAGYIQNGWLDKGGTWYYLSKGNGSMATGWAIIDGKWYYLNGDGSWDSSKIHTEELSLVEGQGSWKREQAGWSFNDTSGNRLTSQWLVIGSSTYYIGANGLVHHGWLDLDGKRYYMNDVSGAMETGNVYIDGQWHAL